MFALEGRREVGGDSPPSACQHSGTKHSAPCDTAKAPLSQGLSLDNNQLTGTIPEGLRLPSDLQVRAGHRSLVALPLLEHV